MISKMEKERMFALRALFKQLRPYDYLIVVLAILLSFIPNVITATIYSNSVEEVQTVVRVKIGRDIVDTFPLQEDGEHIIKAYYPNPGQYNIIEVENDRARIKEDNSPDQIGVNTGWISQPGQVAICLPHGLMIEVVGTQIEDDDLVLPFSS